MKFRIIVNDENIDLTEQYFEIGLRNRWGQSLRDDEGNIIVITSDDCFQDADGNYYFTVENVQNGIIHACFTAWADDDDYIKRQRVYSDVQHLASVGICECGDIVCSGQECRCGHIVSYMQVWTVNEDDGIYLVGSDGAYILTSDDNRIKFPKE